MKTIVERAVEYADKHKATEINYFGVGKVYDYPRIYNAEITAYERGAKEQKVIDINKAYEWLKENIGKEEMRVNAISAGPIKTISAKGIKDFNS